MKIIIFEDEFCEWLYPLNKLRGSFDIRCGIYTPKERITALTEGKHEISLFCRNYLATLLRENHKCKVNEIKKEEYLFLNGRTIFSYDSLKYIISRKEKNTFFTSGNEIVALYLSKENSEFAGQISSKSGFNIKFSGLPEVLKLKKVSLKEDFDIRIIKYPWEVINHFLYGGLLEDIELYLKINKNLKRTKDSQNIINHKKVFVSGSAVLKPNYVFDASDGPVIIGENVVIEPFTYIKGPSYIGKNSLIKSGTKIYGPAVIGEQSKVAGEIAESIFHSYVNKQHDGFVGHSYICPFVNLGADTVTSDLKNNYSKIKIGKGSEGIDTGMQFLGSIIGDHTKTSINTMLNTGTVCGIFANIFGSGFPEKTIDSFAWYDSSLPDEKIQVKYDFKKALQTARTVMERRGVVLSESYEKLMKYYYDLPE